METQPASFENGPFQQKCHFTPVIRFKKRTIISDENDAVRSFKVCNYLETGHLQSSQNNTAMLPHKLSSGNRIVLIIFKAIRRVCSSCENCL